MPLLENVSSEAPNTGSRSFDRDYLVKNSTITTLCRGVGVASGLALDAVIMAVFGLGLEADSFFGALAVPFMISSAVGTQFSQVLVPMIARIDLDSGRARTWVFVSHVITAWCAIACLFSLVGMATAGITVPLQVPGLQPGGALLATRISMVLVWLVLVRGIGDILSSVLYAFHKYWLASLSRTITQIATIVVLLALQSRFGIYALAIAFIAGAAAQCAVLGWALSRMGFRFSPGCRISDPELRTLARLMLNPTAGQMLGECRALLENYFASYCGPGVLSGLKYATRIITSVSSIMVGSVVTASLPLISANMAEKNAAEMKRNVMRAMKLLMLLSLPLSAWLIFNGESLVSLLFERGKFLRSDAALISGFMALMTPYILFGRVVSLTQTPFYAVMDTKAPLIGMIISFIAYLVFTPALVYFFRIYGFPASTSLTAIFAAVVMAVLMRRSFGVMGWGELHGFTRKLLFAVAASCAGYVVGHLLLADSPSLSLMDKAVALAVPSILGLAAFLASALLLGLVDSADLLRRLRRVSSGMSCQTR